MGCVDAQTSGSGTTTKRMTSQDVLDFVKLVFIVFAPPLIWFFGAAAGAYAIDRFIHAATPQEALNAQAMGVVILLLIPALLAAVASFAMKVSIHGVRIMRLVPRLLVAGLIISIILTQLYHHLPALTEDVKQLTALASISSTGMIYIIAACRLTG